MSPKAQRFCLAAIAVCIFILASFAVHKAHDAGSEQIAVIRYESCNQCKIEQKKEVGFREALLTDPVATFTALLFFATAWLAFLTFRLVRDAREGAANQSEATQRSLAEAARSAKAAEDGLAHARQVSSQQLRAYMSFVLLDIRQGSDENNAVIGYSFLARWQNAGQTPAVNSTSEVNRTFVFEGDTAVFENRVDDRPFMMAPVGPGMTALCGLVNVHINEIIGQMRGEFRIAVLFDFLYEDVFGSRYVERACTEILFIGRDPTLRMEGPQDNTQNPFMMRQVEFRFVHHF